MDRSKAKRLEQNLKGKEVKGYKVISLINNGKSAAVFKAKDSDNNFFALKIFDNDIIERFGHKVQVDRIEKEIALKNHEIRNLVKIYEGGTELIGDARYYFIIMEYITGHNLKDYLKSTIVNEEFVISLLSSLFNTAESLIELGIAHRDIKPENIMVDNDRNIIVMDLGVLKLIGNRDFTDLEQKEFIGTLRYAAPEFLLRKELNSIQGWRAVNLYQIGATLHDAIMEKELFIDVHPFSRLVLAIKEDMPLINNSKYSPELIQLTRDMLSKDWGKRLRIVTNDRIQKTIDFELSVKDDLEIELSRALKKTIKTRATFDNIVNIKRSKEENDKIQKGNIQTIIGKIKKYIYSLKQEGLYTEIQFGDLFDVSDMYRIKPKNIERLQFVRISGSLGDGFSQPLFFLINCKTDSQFNTIIEFVGFLLSPMLSDKPNLEKSLLNSLINELGKIDIMRGMKNTYIIPFVSVFNGIFQDGDYAKKKIQIEFVKVLNRAKDQMESEVYQFLKKGYEFAPKKETPNFYGGYQSLDSDVNKEVKSIVLGRTP